MPPTSASACRWRTCTRSSSAPSWSEAHAVTTAAEDTPAEAALRAEVRAWMADHAARFGPSDRHIRMVDTVEIAAAARSWQRELDEGGWGAPTWPHELGGRGLSANEAPLVPEEQSRYATPTGPFHLALP